MGRREEHTVAFKVSPAGVRASIWILSFTGFVLSCLAVSSCRFAQVTTATGLSSISIKFVGIYNFQTSSGLCAPTSLLSSLPLYEGTSSSLKAARAFGVLAALTGGFIAIWMLISIVLTGTIKSLWTTQACLLAVSTVFQLIVFITFNDDVCKDDKVNEVFVKCTIDEGAAFAISASLFYLLSSIGVFIVSPPRSPLICFDEWCRDVGTAEVKGDGSGSKNGSAAQTAVVVHREEQPNISSTAPPMETYPNHNLLNAGASVFPSDPPTEKPDGRVVDV